MASKAQKLIELSRRIEEALGLIDRRIDALTMLIDQGRLRPKEKHLHIAERDVLNTVADALRRERSNPSLRSVERLGRVALGALFLAGSVQDLGARANGLVASAVSTMIEAAKDSDDEEAEEPTGYSEQEVEDAIAIVRETYRPASRDDIPWDDEDGKWIAPVLDTWDVVEDALYDKPEGLRRVVIARLLHEEAGDWIAEEYLRTMEE